MNSSTATAWRTTCSGPRCGGNKKLTHNLGTWPKRGRKESKFKFDNPGVVPLLCNVHPGDVSVLDRLSHSLLCDDEQGCGNYKIENVPDGALHGDGMA